MIQISENIKNRLSTLVIPIVLVLVWQIVTSGGYVSSHFLPSPGTLFHYTVKLFVEQGFLLHILVSLKRVLFGFLIGSVTGFLFGLLMGLSKTAEKILAPTFHVIRQVPIIGWIPLIVMWCGMTELPRIIIISIAAFYPITLNTFSGVRSVSKEYIELGAVYGYKRLKFIRKIVLIWLSDMFPLNKAPIVVPSCQVTIYFGNSKDLADELKNIIRRNIAIKR